MKAEEIVKNTFDDWEAEEAKEMDFGGRVAELLKDREMSQRDLAAAVKVTEVTMSRYISNQRTPKGPVIVAIAKTLGVSCDYLLGMEKKEEVTLKPCPFCGGDPVIMRMGFPHWIYCGTCGAKIHGHVIGDVEGERASIKAWNRRVE